MSIRRKLAATGATAALVLGGLTIATPAYAGSWNPIYGSKNVCLAQTRKKLNSIQKTNPAWVKIRYKCRHVNGYYGSSIDWRNR